MKYKIIFLIIGFGFFLTSNSQTGESAFKKINAVKSDSLEKNQSQFKKISISNNSKLKSVDKSENKFKTISASKNEQEITKSETDDNKFRIISEVDVKIPDNTPKNQNKFALIIGNEDYSSFQTGLNQEVNVDFAANDATIFKEYANKCLGVPEENIIYKINARSIEMNKMLEKIVLIAKSLQGDTEIYVYYAGHGLPDIQSHEPYIMPVDCSGEDLTYAIKLSNLYKKLSENDCKKVVVFLDACFSGGARNQGLVAARGVKVTPKAEGLAKNIVVFSATSEEQPALAWKEKGHGMFTYFLLKKLQDTDANLTYGELSDYLSKNVGVKSALVNNREQTPKTLVGSSIQNNWREIKIK
jgi:hypothetical protein